MKVTHYQAVRKGERIMTVCEGGVCLKPAPEDGLLLYSDERAVPAFLTRSLFNVIALDEVKW